MYLADLNTDAHDLTEHEQVSRWFWNQCWFASQHAGVAWG